MIPPDHLTPFGAWLWTRWPFPARDDIARGEAFKGFRSPQGVMVFGVLVDWYHGYWPRIGLLYRRKSVWVCGRKVWTWHQISKECAWNPNGTL
jgi:hypothetical protein